jgi:microcystin-dependent protein
MSVNVYDKNNDKLNLVAGGTLYADSPIGSILPYGGANAPSGWLLCQGQAVSRTTYSDLFSAIGTTFGSGDGSTTFNLPDLRDKAVMGAGTNGVLGASQLAQLPNITGKIDNKTGTFGIMGFSSSVNSYKGAFTGSEAKGAVYTGQNNTSACKVVTFDASDSDASTDINGNNVYTNNGETRPANVRLNYIIKAKHTPVPADFSDSLIGYLGQETNYNLYPWSHERAQDGADISEDFVIERDGWYSIDYTLSSGTAANHSFTLRDFDSQGEVHTIMRCHNDRGGTLRQTYLIPLKAGTYRYSHGGIGTLSVYMNRRDFA